MGTEKIMKNKYLPKIIELVLAFLVVMAITH